jgi:predicted ester cyclase
MSPFLRLLGASALALLATVSLDQSSSAADQVAANAALLAKYVAAFNAHNAAALEDVIAENYIQHNGRAGQGLAGIEATARVYFKTFGDFHMTLEDSVISNDKVVARFLVTAIHDHPVRLGPPGAPVFPPTGKKLAWQGISIWRVADGKFVEHWDEDDLLGLVQQLRAQPPGGGK